MYMLYTIYVYNIYIYICIYDVQFTQEKISTIQRHFKNMRAPGEKIKIIEEIKVINTLTKVKKLF